MFRYPSRLYTLVILAMLLLGCSAAGARQDLLRQLTHVDEAARFAVIDEARAKLSQIKKAEIESTLTALQPKNVSTLIYLFIQTGNKGFYNLSPPARQALERTAGAFPNLAYYYARVNPAEGLTELQRLYAAYPAHRLPISLAIGETCRAEAKNFLLSEARTIKAEGNEITTQLAGLKQPCLTVNEAAIDFFLSQELDRE